MDDVARAGAGLAPHGLSVRGGFDFGEGESSPPALAGPARSVLLIGNVGGAFWPHFQGWLRRQGAHADPLDAWSRETIDPIAGRLGARAVYPFERPHLPFQQWAMRAEGLRSSPLGILMHPEFGVWHAYRGALLFERPLELSSADPGGHACDLCLAKPCKSACPVGAHAGAVFAYHDCLEWAGSQSGAPCRSHGCIDRNACPVGAEHRYPPELRSFLMCSFLR